MSKKIKEIDDYISRSKPFARPVLIHLRTLIHETCPDVEEKMKWSFPHFDYKGMMCSMASFKEHCSFNFWKAPLMKGLGGLKTSAEKGGMGVFGKIKSLQDLPSDKKIVSLLLEAMKLNDDDVKLKTKRTNEPKKELLIPVYFMNALRKKKKALDFFLNSSYSCKKEYIAWIEEAKTEETRNKRVDTSVKWLAEGRQRNWKYVKK